MREPRVFTLQALREGAELRLEDAPSRHLLKVLRLKPHAALRLFCGDGFEYAATLGAASRESAQVLVGANLAEEPLPAFALNLCVGVSKGERMDFTVQKAVELGVTRILPVFTKRSMVQLKGERLTRRLEHWHQVMIGACEQSGRCRLPELLAPTELSAALAQSNSDLRLVLHHRAESALRDLDPPHRGVDLLIGPEGGLEPAEIDLARRHGHIPVRLGPRVMRTETAPIAALAAIQTLWGDFCAC